MTDTPTASAPSGVPITTSITAGAADECPLGTCNGQNNHAEGIVCHDPRPAVPLAT